MHVFPNAQVQKLKMKSTCLCITKRQLFLFLLKVNVFFVIVFVFSVRVVISMKAAFAIILYCVAENFAAEIPLPAAISLSAFLNFVSTFKSSTQSGSCL